MVFSYKKDVKVRDFENQSTKLIFEKLINESRELFASGLEIILRSRNEKWTEAGIKMTANAIELWDQISSSGVLAPEFYRCPIGYGLEIDLHSI